MNQNNAAVVLHDTGKRKAAAGRAARFLLMFVLAFGAQAAMAAGGFSEATGPLEKVRDTIYTIVGIVATIALLWQCALGFMQKKDWPDVLGTCLWIVSAGAGIALATYLFTQGGKMKFS